MSGATGVLAIARAELRMLVRNKAVAAVAVAGLQVLVMLGIGVYATATTTLASRRKDLFLKRLRSGTLPDSAIFAGLLLPVALVAVVQIAIIFGVLATVTGVTPGNITLLGTGVVAAALMCVGVAMATSAVTVSAEQAQVTSVPFLLAILAGGIWVSSTGLDELTWIKRLAPGGAVSEVVSGAWAGMKWTDALPGLLALVGWATASAAAGLRFFRWEPRH